MLQDSNKPQAHSTSYKVYLTAVACMLMLQDSNKPDTHLTSYKVYLTDQLQGVC